ncbi:MAG: type III pantothenate kinase [Gallionellaceae bacterium]|nr:type III pantothenate kinase [Gallionellaceae bacterium]
MKILLIDAGNSRIKWALAENRVWSQQGVVENARVTTLRTIFSELPAPHKIVVSNVAGQEMAQQLQMACATWPLPLEFITAHAEKCGIRNSYQQAQQLGSDRWAALIAAWQQEHTTCLVINCGTATTIDALSAQGEFLGGLILPGVDMMQRSIAAGVVQATTASGAWQAFPRNTADALFTGAIQATAGAICLQFERLLAPQARCILSGGAAYKIEPHLNLPLVRVDNLVLRGLQIIGQEQKMGA